MPKKLTDGSVYRVGHIDTANEIVPLSAAFRTFPGEKHIFEERTRNVSYFEVINAIQQGVITELDKTVLSLVAVFASAACTTRTLFELLTMMGVDMNRNTLESSIKRLNRYHLISLSGFQSPDGKRSNAKVIMLAKHGSGIARSLGVYHLFNQFGPSLATPSQIKSRVESVQLIVNWLKNLPVDKFAVRPLIKVNPDEGAIVSPNASIRLWDETIYFEVPRRDDEYLEGLLDKLHRYDLVFANRETPPTIVINGEDVEMNREIHNALKANPPRCEIMFTDDLAMFGKGFETCLYTFNPSDEIVRFQITPREQEESDPTDTETTIEAGEGE